MHAENDSPAPRRTQVERRTQTRLSLLDATIESLVEVGYAKTTTTEVTRRAGVSQGALFKHFATKSALVAAAAEHLFEGLFVDFESAFESSPEREAPVVVAMRRLWDVFCKPELLAVYRLYAEAPVDDELMAALVPVVKRHEENLSSFAVSLFPEIASSAAHTSMFVGVVYAMQGLSMQRPVYVNPAHERLVLDQFESIARTLFPAARPRIRKGKTS